ncbi:MAG: hypothetical protein ABI131_09820 [Nostocoides sp.]
MDGFPDEVRDLLRLQDSLVTRGQLLQHGVKTSQVRWNAGRNWRVVLPFVFLMTRSEPTPRQRLIAGLLWAGPRSVLAGPTAARLHGIRSVPDENTVHLLVPATHRSRTNTFATSRSCTLHDPDIVTRGAIRISSPARACVDAALAARTASDRSAILIEAVQRELASLDDLAEWVNRLRPRDVVDLRPALVEAASGAWSVPEAELLDLVASSAILPPALANPALADATGRPLLTPDAWFDDVAKAVMVHSHTHHSQGEQWDSTVERDGGLVAAGVIVAGVKPRRIRSEPATVLQRLERTYAAALARPRPPVVATPRAQVRRPEARAKRSA